MNLTSGLILGAVFLILLAGLVYWAFKASKDIPKPSEARSYTKMSRRELKRRERSL